MEAGLEDADDELLFAVAVALFADESVVVVFEDGHGALSGSSEDLVLGEGLHEEFDGESGGGAFESHDGARGDDLGERDLQGVEAVVGLDLHESGELSADAVELRDGLFGDEDAVLEGLEESFVELSEAEEVEGVVVVADGGEV